MSIYCQIHRHTGRKGEAGGTRTSSEKFLEYYITRVLLETRAWNLQSPVICLKTMSKFVFQFSWIKTSLSLFFFSHGSMEFEYSPVKWFSRQFSVGFTYFHIQFDLLYN